MRKSVLALLAWSVAGPTLAVAPPKFDSVYTDLGQNCAEPPGLETAEGQDPLLSCRGPGEYWVYLSFSAADAALNVGIKRTPWEQWLEARIPGIDAERGKVEWRLADGDPIALIVRSTPIVFDDAGQPKPGPAQTLEIRGLGRMRGFEAQVDSRATANANDEARARVEAEYQRRFQH